ncbi:MAG: hypothetical protein ACO1O1_07690 [Adhaeribacter sp.]
MAIFLTAVIAAFLGYIYGYYIRPRQNLRRAIREVREKCQAVLQAGNKGVFRTFVTDKDQTSELVVEIQQQAYTQNGQVKVQYLSAYYKNPAFRTRKGEALLNEVHGLLGDYLPENEIEWYDNSQKQEQIKKYLNNLVITQHNLL